MRLDSRGIAIVNWLEREYKSLSLVPKDHPYMIEFREKYGKCESKKKYEKQLRLTTTKEIWCTLDSVASRLETTRPELLRFWLEDYTRIRYDIYDESFTQPKVDKYSYLQVSGKIHNTIESKTKKYALKETEIVNRIIHKNLRDYQGSLYLI